MFSSWRLIRKHLAHWTWKKKLCGKPGLCTTLPSGGHVHIQNNFRWFLDQFSSFFFLCAFITCSQLPFYHLLSFTPPTAHIVVACWLVGSAASGQGHWGWLMSGMPLVTPRLFFLDFSLGQCARSSLGALDKWQHSGKSDPQPKLVA